MIYKRTGHDQAIKRVHGPLDTDCFRCNHAKRYRANADPKRSVQRCIEFFRRRGNPFSLEQVIEFKQHHRGNEQLVGAVDLALRFAAQFPNFAIVQIDTHVRVKTRRSQKFVVLGPPGFKFGHQSRVRFHNGL